MKDKQGNNRQNESISPKRLARWLRIIEVGLPLLVIVLIILSWFVALNYQRTLVETVIASYQETQLEVVRAVARSIHPFLEDHISRGDSIDNVEQQILKRFVAPVQLLQNGDAWIYAPDHVVFDLSSDFPDIYRDKSMKEIFALQAKKGAVHYEGMSTAVTQAREGVGWYVWLPDKGREIAAWTPVRFGSYVWTIGLSTPLPEILRATGAERQKQMMQAVMSLATLFGICFSLSALWWERRRRQLHQAIERQNRELQSLVGNLENEVNRRSASESATKELHERLNTLIEALPDVIHFKDNRGRNLVVNKAYENMAGMDKQSILGKQDDDLLPPDIAEQCKAADDRVRKEKTAVRFETTQRLSDGRVVYWDGFKAPLFDEEGRLTGLVCVNRDVTDYKEAEKERQRLRERLLISQKMEAIGTLAGGVAHDLNNILSGIINYPELLIDRLPPDDPLLRPLQVIQSAGERAASIVQDLLIMARRGVADKQVLDVNTIITDYVKSPAHRKRVLAHFDVWVDLRLDADLMRIRGSSDDIAKIVMNLIINAQESFDGPGTITVSTENRYLDDVKVGTTDIKEGEYVHLSVSDDGPGISPEDLPRIFEPFFTKNKLGMSSTGLGLAVVWGTVQDHHGAIDVKSTPGEGTVFDVFLPATREVPAQPPEKIERERLMARKESILVVDDIPLQRDIAHEMLTGLGYRVHVVESGEAAVEYLQNHTVDLVLLDMIMGDGMDGLDTYRAISALQDIPKVIIASGYAETDRVREAQRLGAGAYVKKPFLMEILARAIRRELEK